MPVAFKCYTTESERKKYLNTICLNNLYEVCISATEPKCSAGLVEFILLEKIKKLKVYIFLY